MLRVRRIYDDALPVNKEELRQVKEILRSRFSVTDEKEIESIGEKLRNPFKQRFRTILFVAESVKERVDGFAILLHEPLLSFTYLDWIAITAKRASSGIGSVLYERVRQESAALKVKGLFFECLPDSETFCSEPEILQENSARLRFYEQYGARPIVNTAYETPINPDDSCAPFLVYDGLENKKPPSKTFVRKAVRAVLERKYSDICSPEYVDTVVSSFNDDPVQLRPFLYVKPEVASNTVESRSTEQIAVVVNDRHDIHHINDKGYVESPVRVRSILKELDKSGLFVQIKPRHYANHHLHPVHTSDLVGYLKNACADMPEGKSLYPYIFPIRNKMRPPKEKSVLAGYYCIDTFTPINRNAYPAARRAVDCALTAADEVLNGRRIAYALVRPPGHHAESGAFGGFCYFNNSAVAAHYLSGYGRTVVLDIDYHHGNGTQEIFYRRDDVLTISIHGHPSFAYPYFSGFEEEKGEGEGEGFNLNIPLPESVDGVKYRRALQKVLERVEAFNPAFLVVALGLDPAKGDPTGTWSLLAKDFQENGKMIGALGLPTIVIQEGGYKTRTLGINAMRFFKGLSLAIQRWADSRHPVKSKIQGIAYRYEVEEADLERVAKLASRTGFFSAEEVDVAVELVQERLEKGDASGYNFIIAEHYGRLVSYTCYGAIPCTQSGHDLYWIVVHPDYQGRGVGKSILKETEHAIRSGGGERVYADTSQRLQYASTRAFYENNGYLQVSLLPDFYGPDDGKVVYCKNLLKK